MKEHRSVALMDYREFSVQEMRSRAKEHYEIMCRRHSIRAFSDRPVPREVIEYCIRAAGTAPSGANHQPWHFAMVGSSAMKAEIRLAAEKEERDFYAGRAGQEWLDALEPLGTDSFKPYLESAPWLIPIFAQSRGGIEEDGRQKNYYVKESVGIATGFLIQALHHAGLVTLTHTPQPMKFLNEICGRPAHEKAYMLLVTGFPAESATIPVHALKKKGFEEICTVFE